MTCIVALEHDGYVWLGTDSAASNGHTLSIVDTPKIIKNGNLVFGYTSSFRFADLLRFKLKFPNQKRGQDDRDYIVGVVVEKIRNSLKAGGFAKVTEGCRESGGTALIAYRGKVYTLQDDFSIIRYVDGYSSCGSGGELALGSLATTAALDVKPEDRVRLALQVAAKHCCTVEGPEHIVKIGK